MACCPLSSSGSTSLPSLSHCILDQPVFTDASRIITNIGVQNIVCDPAPATRGIPQSKDAGVEGLHLLYNSSDPSISLYSSARHRAPRCHNGEFAPDIKILVESALDPHLRPPGLISIYGPVGVGKSANAQSFAEALGREGKLASAVFPSCRCLMSEELCHSKVLPTIAYHISTVDAEFGQAVGTRIRHNPALLSEALPQQFFNLLVAPSQTLAAQGKEIAQRVIIIDGIDRCRDIRAQRDIISLIVESVQKKSTPFLWVFFTRDEPHLRSLFSVSPCQSLELTISRDLDPMISTFLSDSLNEVGERQGFATPWLVPGVVDILVDKSGGFPLYASSLVQFIGGGPLDPNQQLQTILENNQFPLPGVDDCYTAFLRNMPLPTLRRAQKILLAISVLPHAGVYSNTIIQFLNISEREFNIVCQALLPVLYVSNNPDGNGLRISFYHPTFMEFMQDSSRSKDLCLWSCAEALRQKMFGRLVQAQENLGQIDYSQITSLSISTETEPIPLDNFVPGDTYENFVSAFFRLCQEPVPFRAGSDHLLTALMEYPFANICLLGEPTRVFMDMERFLQNIPITFRPKVIRSFRGRNRFSLFIDRINMPADAEMEYSYTLGHGSGKAYCWGSINKDHLVFVPCPKHRILHYFRHLILGHSIT